MRLMQDGQVPSITDVAAAAQVSRATAYRYFPTQSALIQASVDEALGPILRWDSRSTDALERVHELIRFSYPRLDQYEPPLRAALRLALDQWARAQAGKLGEEAVLPRGRRIALLRSALAPLRKRLSRSQSERLAQALSLVFGTEAFVVLKDIWHLSARQAQDVAVWTAGALIKAALEDAVPQRGRLQLGAGRAPGIQAEAPTRSRSTLEERGPRRKKQSVTQGTRPKAAARRPGGDNSN